jgi:uncharacterized membrane protein
LSTEEYTEKRLDELRQLILDQLRQIYERLDRMRDELKEVKARSEKLESLGRRG